MTHLLELDDVHVYYGPFHALRGNTLTVGEGEIVSLLGGNASGKSTTMKTILGLTKVRSGIVRFAGEDVTRASTRHRVQAGIASVPEARRVFPQMTVDENLLSGAYTRHGRAGIAEDLERMRDPLPAARGASQAGGRHPLRRRAADARVRPGADEPAAAVCMDEPTMGLSPKFVDQVLDEIVRINIELGVAVLLVEQQAELALSIASRGYVLATGEIVLQGAADACSATRRSRRPTSERRRANDRPTTRVLHSAARRRARGPAVPERDRADVHAEGLGFDTAWVAQHHFHRDEGGLPSPFVLLAQAAARTSRIALATGIVTLPLEAPVRVAEDAAVLSLLADGRFELGIGSGGTPSSFAPFGQDVARRPEIYAEHKAVLLRALRGEVLTTDGGALYPPAPGLADRSGRRPSPRRRRAHRRSRERPDAVPHPAPPRVHRPRVRRRPGPDRRRLRGRAARRDARRA